MAYVSATCAHLKNCSNTSSGLHTLFIGVGVHYQSEGSGVGVDGVEAELSSLSTLGSVCTVASSGFGKRSILDRFLNEQAGSGDGGGFESMLNISCKVTCFWEDY